MSVEIIDRERPIYPEKAQMVGQLALFELNPLELIQLDVIQVQRIMAALPQAERNALRKQIKRASTSRDEFSGTGPGQQ